jgi:hypothetical protein
MTDLSTHCDCRAIHQRKRIVLTGGPGAGQTSLLRTGEFPSDREECPIESVPQSEIGSISGLIGLAQLMKQ